MRIMSAVHPRGPSLGHHLIDFANMLKAFIGSNYLTVAFAFRQSGVALGLVGLIVIATLTAHCCHLLIKCKYQVIRLVLQDTQLGQYNDSHTGKCFEMQNKGEGSLSSTNSNESSSDEEDDDEEVDKDAKHKKLLRNLNYGNIGELCMGKAGLTLVNSAVFITQFGFCVGYFIFVGNTLHSMFPLYNCSMTLNTSATEYGSIQQCFEVKHLNSLNAVHVDMEEMTETLPGVLHHKRATPFGEYLSPTPSSIDSFITFLASENISSVQTAINLTSAPAFFNKSRTEMVPFNAVDRISRTETQPTVNLTLKAQLHLKDALQNISETETYETNASGVVSEKIPNKEFMPSGIILPTNDTDQNVTTELNTKSHHDFAVTTPSENNSTLIPTGNTWANKTEWKLTRGKHIPDLRLLVLLPTIIFVPMTLIRSLRHMGFISFIANASIFVGCVEVLLFLVIGFSTSNTFVWANWTNLPIFFGMVTSSFEGIGTLLPIESSMEGNRHNFPKFLNGAVAVLALVLALFGILGYLRFGYGVQQMINANIPGGHWLSVAVNACLCVGVLLTFPLMIYPVVELAELHLFGNGRLCGPKSEKSNTNDVESLLPRKKSSGFLPVGEKISSSVPTWKRNVLRIFLVICAGILAIVLRNYFAYISAFVGALGSTMLAYILPCLFHLKLCWSQLPIYVKVKDSTIIAVGTFCGIAGIYAVILEIVSSVHL